MHVAAVPVLGIIFNILLRCIEADLTLDFKVTKISASHKAANCNVANTTYAHGETFKLDCKTQCVCENGRHACSSLCPKEQLPAPEDTISCRSPRLVEVPGHCCKMWLCENPTADVYATCHNSSTSPWTPCSRTCGLGISTRFTITAAGCSQLSNLRLCENRKCEIQRQAEQAVERVADRRKQKHLMKTKQLKHKLKRQQQKYAFDIKHQPQVLQEHRIRKGHECRSLQRLGPARIRLGPCVSRKLYRPKICGLCHTNSKCCVPSVSTTIQVELLCPLNAMDPISFVQQQLNAKQQKQFATFYPKASVSSNSPLALASLWDTHSLDAIDQEYLQSHQVQIANKFIAVEWILKCECTKNDNCQRIVNATAATREGTSSSSASSSSSSNSRRLKNSGSNTNDRRYQEYAGNENIDMGNHVNNDNNNENKNNNQNMPNVNSFKFNRNNNDNNNMKYISTQIGKIRDIITNRNVNENDDGQGEEDADARETDANNDRDTNINSYTNTHAYSFNRKKQTNDYDENAKSNNNENMINNQNNVKSDDNDNDENEDEDGAEDEDEDEEQNGTPNSLLSSDEIQPDIIPYPPPPFSANKHTGTGTGTGTGNNNNVNTNKNNKQNTQTNWIKKKFNAEYGKRNKQQHSKQQRQQRQQQEQQQQHYYEHWLLQQYNNQPYQRDDFST